MGNDAISTNDAFELTDDEVLANLEDYFNYPFYVHGSMHSVSVKASYNVWREYMNQVAKLERMAQARDALQALDTWLHFKQEWGTHEALVPVTEVEVAGFRKALADACEALYGERPEKQEE